jgi:hypothetical protein
MTVPWPLSGETSRIEIGIAIGIEKIWDRDTKPPTFTASRGSHGRNAQRIRRRGYCITEDFVPYECSEFDCDPDGDLDPDER